jgi:ribose transport system ATP-binding protein
MIGREYKNVFPPKSTADRPETPALACSGLSWAGRLNDISFALHAGEVVGLGGLDGQGQRDLLLALFGVLRGVSGKLEIGGKPARISDPSAAKGGDAAMALIPEDRKTEGLMLPMSIAENLCFAALDRISSRGIVDASKRADRVARMIELLKIKVADPDLPVSSLSGGNQQKVVIAKWLMNDPRIVLLNDPTRGIDVGTKQEIYALLRRLADDGVAILFYSTDYDELIGCCDRVLVMYDGAIVRTLEGEAITEHALVASALNISEAHPA